MRRAGSTTAAMVTMLMTVMLVAGGCAIRPAEIPIPGVNAIGASYPVDIEFTSALNLPDRAKVLVGGVDAGVVENVRLVSDHAVVTAMISRDVRLPMSTTAELRQSTLLGEIYVYLQPPQDGGLAEGYLGAGDTIPLARTKPADNVEDVLRGLSDITTGGRLVDIQSAIAKFNSAVPEQPGDVERIIGFAKRALADLADNTDDIDRILDEARGITTTLERQKGDVDRILTLGPPRLAGLSDVLFGVVHIIFEFGYLSKNIGTLVNPIQGDLKSLISVIAPAVVTGANLDISIPLNVDKVNKLLRDKLIPYFSREPNIRVRSVKMNSATSEERADDMIAVLRGMGMVR